MRNMLLAFAMLVGFQAQAAPVVDFTGPFAPDQWTATVGVDGDAPSHDATSLSISSPRPEGLDESTTTLTVGVPDAGTISFSWDYVTSDSFADPFADPFGFLVDGTFVQLTDDFGDISQSGSALVPVDSGQNFGFFATALFGDFGTATTRVTNFVFTPFDDGTVPEPGTIALLAAALAGTLAARRRFRA